MGAHPDNDLCVLLSWPEGGQPERELRTASTEEREGWLQALRFALRLDRLRSGKRPQGALGGGGAAGGVGVGGTAGGAKPTESAKKDDAKAETPACGTGACPACN